MKFSRNELNALKVVGLEKIVDRILELDARNSELQDIINEAAHMLEESDIFTQPMRKKIVDAARGE